jgi:hypothetical protein
MRARQSKRFKSSRDSKKGFLAEEFAVEGGSDSML